MCWKLIVPWFPIRLLPVMLGYAALGAVLAGLYGAVHDQISYSISPEYFTQLKFYQFDYANFGFPPRVFAAEVGFLATWWVGLFAAWFLARMAVPALPPGLAWRHTMRGFVIVLAGAAAAFAVGYVVGRIHVACSTLDSWRRVADQLGVEDLPAFVCVADIHLASYLGGLLGLIVAMVDMKRAIAKRAKSEAS